MARATLHNVDCTLTHRADEPEVVVCFSFHPGRPETPPAYAHGGLPADPPEIEILSVTGQDGLPVQLTDEEDKALCVHLMENLPEPDYPEDD